MGGGAFDSAKIHEHQRLKRQSVTAKRVAVLSANAASANP